MTIPRLFAVGAAHMDRRGRVHGTYVPAASNPGTMREEVGGGGFNALRNAVRQGVLGAILSLRGGDLAGDTVAREIAQWGIEDRSAVFLDRTTPSYTALLDHDGELIAGFADMGLYEAGFVRQLRRKAIREAAGEADAVLCDANLPAEAIAGLARLAAGKPLFAVAISVAKVVRLAQALPNVSCLFMNLREARTLAGGDVTAAEAVPVLQAQGLVRGIITEGSAPLTGFDADGIFTLDAPAARSVADVTGAGDAVAGATIACLMRGMALREAVRHGMAASLLTVESANVVAEYDDDAFAAALALVGRPRPVA